MDQLVEIIGIVVILSYVVYLVSKGIEHSVKCKNQKRSCE